jgi:hypothetical protein
MPSPVMKRAELDGLLARGAVATKSGGSALVLMDADTVRTMLAQAVGAQLKSVVAEVAEVLSTELEAREEALLERLREEIGNAGKGANAQTQRVLFDFKTALLERVNSVLRQLDATPAAMKDMAAMHAQAASEQAAAIKELAARPTSDRDTMGLLQRILGLLQRPTPAPKALPAPVREPPTYRFLIRRDSFGRIEAVTASPEKP